jgi:PEP-CTERM motif-containing protein
LTITIPDITLFSDADIPGADKGEPFKDTITITARSDVAVAEPGTLALLAAGLLGLDIIRRRKAV